MIKLKWNYQLFPFYFGMKTIEIHELRKIDITMDQLFKHVVLCIRPWENGFPFYTSTTQITFY